MKSTVQNALFSITVVISLTLALTSCTQEKTRIEEHYNHAEQKNKPKDHTHENYERDGHEHDGGMHKHVENRQLSDWEGKWQSIYPFLMDGSLDELTKILAEKRSDKTQQEYKEFFETSFRTDIEGLSISDETVTFTQNGETYSADYRYNRFAIPEDGNKSNIRYLFDKVKGEGKAPKYIQFRDPIYRPKKPEHFHVYLGNTSHEELIEHSENFPSYWPKGSTGKDISNDMMGRTSHNHNH